MLTGKEIIERLNKDIFIEPFNIEQVNPNSYNLTLHNELEVYEDNILDCVKQNTTSTIIIPPEGLLLEPGKLYLGRSIERTKTYNLVPGLAGRSSIGRLGVSIHASAGFGDVGFEGHWTMGIHCVQPVIIYPGMKISQVFYTELTGDITNYCSTKYQGNTGTMASKIYEEL